MHGIENQDSHAKIGVNDMETWEQTQAGMPGDGQTSLFKSVTDVGGSVLQGVLLCGSEC